MNSLQLLALLMGVPLQTIRDGKKCPLAQIVVKPEGIDAAYLMPGVVHAVTIDCKFDFGDPIKSAEESEPDPHKGWEKEADEGNLQ